MFGADHFGTVQTPSKSRHQLLPDLTSFMSLSFSSKLMFPSLSLLNRCTCSMASNYHGPSYQSVIDDVSCARRNSAEA